MTKETGETIVWADYDAWGKPLSPQGHDMNTAGVDNAIGFTSYTYDIVLDIYFAQARFYDANSRRFISVGPIKDGINWYAYCEGNPITFVDPSGLESWIIVALYADDPAENQRNKNQAEIRKEMYEAQYGTTCFIKYVSNAEQFTKDWNDIGTVYGRHISRTVPIDAVEIISHGILMPDSTVDRIGGLLLDKGTTFSANDVSTLQTKEMDALYFSACNTANQDFDLNIATAFYDHNPGIKSVSGWDGGVVFVFTDRSNAIPIPGLRGRTGTEVTVNEDRSSPSQWTFNRLIRQTGNTRQPGKITLSR